MGWVDISVVLSDAMVHWPDDPPVKIRRVSDVALGDSYTLSEISMGSHTGTHIDAPLHFIKGASGVDGMPLDTLVGRARVIEIDDPHSVTPQNLSRQRIRRGERLLFKTRNSSGAWKTGEFVEDFVFMSGEAADMLAGLRVKAVGVDYLSVGSFRHGGSDVHRTLLNAGIWIIEGLDLSAVEAGVYDLVCLPLRIRDGDGSPARAIVRKVG